MPNTSRSPTKRNAQDSAKKQESSLNRSGSSSRSSCRSRARKRKLCEIAGSTEDELESQLVDCNMEDAIAIEKKLRKIARSNALSDEEMRMLLQKFVKNEHILALVTLKAEDELAREQREAEKRAIIITDTPSVPKLTRAKAKELNRAHAIALPKLADTGSKEIASLIVEELHSDEDDEEYTFQEEDFISDDDPNTTISDMDSNPRTPCTPMTQTEFEDSPVKYSVDGCFKVPFDKQADLRIATRTRSKFCLQQTTIEDLQSEFVPPDVEHSDGQDAIELTANDEDWMQFLNDFSKPLNNSFMGDDDDPVNDPEYVAAEKITVDAEELRDVNISKKELTELVAELFEGLLNEGVSLESIELETPQKFVQNNSIIDKPQTPVTPTTPANPTAPSLPVAQKEIVARQIDFEIDAQQETPQRLLMTAPNSQPLQHCVSDATISSTNLLQTECAFQPNVMSTPSSSTQLERIVPIANIPDHHVASRMITLPEAAVRTDPELIAVRVPGQPNCFQLAKVVSSTEDTDKNQTTSDVDTRYTQPYDTNYTFKYISIRKHIYSEYMQKFENLKYGATVSEEEETSLDSETLAAGFTKHQHELLQQQLRIHVQLLAQNFLQTYCHPDLWEFAHKPFKMLQELKEHAKDDASFNAWNLNAAYDLVTEWKERCDVDNAENREMMKFLNKEVHRTSKNTRQIARFPPLIMEQIVNSTVFMYPEYLPRLPFTLRRKDNRYDIFAPTESLLMAMGLEKYLKNGKPVRNKPPTLASACDRISKDMIMGKTPRRIWDRIKTLRLADYYNPVKHFFDHGCSPPVECKLYTFPNNTVLPPKEREAELPMVWQKYVSEKRAKEQLRLPESTTTSPKIRASRAASESYLEFVREAVGEEVFLPDSLTVAAEPEQNGTTSTPTTTPTITITNGDKATPKQSKKRSKANNKKDKRNNKQQTVTINVNYVFGADAATSFLNKSNASNSSSVPALLDASTARDSVLANERNNTLSTSALASSTTIQDITTTTTKGGGGAEQAEPIIAYNFDIANNTWQPLIATTPQAKSTTSLSKSPTSLAKSPSQHADSRQRKLTDYFVVEQVGGKHSAWEDIQNKENFAFEKKRSSLKLKTRRFKARSAFNLSKQYHKAALKHRQKQNRRRRYAALLTNYRLQLQQQLQLYKSKPVVKYFHRHFRALELYSDLLHALKMSCKNLGATTNGVGATAAASTGGGSPLILGKRPRNLASIPAALDDDTNGGRIRKINRQEENFRNMLLPDSAEDANRKDAIYAFNFYEKVEEVFKSSSRPEDCKRFNYILKSFDPKRDKVSELYYKLERLFLPEFPELAQVFLTFLLPSEAAEIGKFFEHFMAENVKTFINKLNIYFHKQPAQLRKVFNCLSELAEEENVTIKTVEARILPLLRGNKFLEDWFMQLFPEVPPPERLLPAPEHVNLKETQNNQSGEFLEHVMNLLDSPTTEQQQQQQQQSQCQLRYINGRIFYGSKITLPAKLSFMAQKFAEEGKVGNSGEDADVFVSNSDGCIHAIRDYGEKRIQAATVAAAVAATTAAADCSSSEDNERTEEDEASKSLVIDSAGDEDSVCSNTYEACDDATLRAHAVRLNPNYYSNGWQNTSTSNAQQAGQTPQSNVTPGGSAKRAASNLSDDVKLSPRKQATAAAAAAAATTATTGQTNSATNPTATASNNNLTQAQREKRKSPVKKIGSAASLNTNNSKTSPISKQRAFNAQPPMVVIHEQNSAIACAKKLKSLIDYSSESDADTKTGIPIVARAKHAKADNLPAAEATTPAEVKIEENSDDMEFLPESAEISTTLPHSSLESVKMDDDSMQEPVVATTTISSKPAAEEQNVVSSSNMESDEDVKLDIVATLSTASNEEEETSKTAATTNCSSTTTTAANCSSTPSMTTTKTVDLTQTPKHSIGHSTHLPAAWTRNEDKIILIEMKLGSRNRDDLFQRIKAKLPERSTLEIAGRHQFLIEFLSKLQGH